MGLRTPQDIRRPSNQRATGRAVFRNPSSAQISGEFLNTTASIANQRQKEAQRLRSIKDDFVFANFDNQADVLKTRAEAELSQAKGQDVFSKSQDIKKSYLDNVKNLVDTLPTEYREDPERAMQLQMRANKHLTRFNKFAIGYEYDQSEKIKEETFKTRVNNDLNAMAEQAADVDFIAGEGADAIENSIRIKALQEYGSGPQAKEIADREVQLGVSKGVRQAVEMQVASSRYDLAQQTIERMKDRMTSEDLVDLEKIITRGRQDDSDNKALALSQEALVAGGDNEQRIEKIIREASQGDGNVYRKAMQFASTNIKIQQREKQRRQEESFNRLYRQQVTAGTMDQREWQSLEPEMRQKLADLLQKNGGRAPVVSKPGLLSEVMDKISVLSDEEVAKMDFETSYGHSLNASDLKRLDQAKRQAQKRLQSGASAGQRFDNAIIRDVIELYDKEYKLSSKSSEEDRDKVQRMLQDRYFELIQENDRITKEQIRKQLTKDMEENLKIKEGFFTDKLEIPETFTNKIPDDMFRKVNAARRLRGQKEFNEQEMEDFLRFTGKLP